ncbi:Uncharacterised protein [Bordetella pertussis]|nr:Uncharacterised protein [Bordetella pertussis]CFO79163.1 Uncharacterised protein [Bordetella pertussis]CFU84829.1 Uncharacterised protein [Bordetella pertussis]CPI67124.1 Uncharacterised protein [Bordetella pertussis]CPL34155.1 Uncharacterised protein [Bordetella pertussis]
MRGQCSLTRCRMGMGMAAPEKMNHSIPRMMDMSKDGSRISICSMVEPSISMLTRCFSIRPITSAGR